MPEAGEGSGLRDRNSSRNLHSKRISFDGLRVSVSIAAAVSDSSETVRVTPIRAATQVFITLKHDGGID